MIDLSKDKDEIIRIGKYRHEISRKKGLNPLNQMTTVKTARRDIIGARGEFACCRALGIDPKTTALYNTSGYPDKGHDAIYRGWLSEFKDTEYPNGHLFYQPKTHSFGQDIWVLAVPIERSNDDDFCWYMRIAGWVWRKEMSGLWQPCFFDSSAWCIEQSQLRSFEDLLNIGEKYSHKAFKKYDESEAYKAFFGKNP